VHGQGGPDVRSGAAPRPPYAQEGARSERDPRTRQVGHPARRADGGGVMALEIRAAVVREKGGPFRLETLRLEEPRPDEVRVRVVATGMCHTDMVARDQLYDVPLPIVLGHEGAGVVDRVGDRVRKVAPGDHVVLTYMW